MDFNLKPLNPRALESALEKAEHYRLLNEPRQAESICLDVLALDSNNARAKVTLILALTDQFARRGDMGLRQARELAAKLPSDHDCHYYNGIICERWAQNVIAKALPRHEFEAYAYLRDAMSFYEQAEKLSPAENDDAVLRWNTCVRILQRNPRFREEPEETGGAEMLDCAPPVSDRS